MLDRVPRPGGPRAAETAPALAIDKLVAGYGRIGVLRDVSLVLGEGRLVTLIGANGAGKSTVLRTISGLLNASAGTIRMRGRDITRSSPYERVATGISQVPEGRQVFSRLSVEDNLLLGGLTRTKRERVQALAEMFEMFPILGAKRRDHALTLSGGQQQMLALARALMAKPSILLMDEPSMGLAPLLVAEIFATIERLRARGLSILLVEQNAQAALAIADYGYVIESGSIGVEGPARDLLQDARVQQLYLGM